MSVRWNYDEPESLRKLSGDAVMRRKNSYPFNINTNDDNNTHVIQRLGLLNDHQIQTLLMDPELNTERGDDRDDADVLHYLLSEHPDKGMRYAAKHGITRLFLAARSEYFKRIDRISDYLHFIPANVIDVAIQNSSVEIFDECIKDITANTAGDINYTYFLLRATKYNQETMVEHFIAKGANVKDSCALDVAVELGFPSVAIMLLHEIRRQTPDDNEFYIRYHLNALNNSIEYRHFDVFLIIVLNYTMDTNDVNDLFHAAVQYGKMDFIRVFLTDYNDAIHDDDGQILKTAFYHDNSIIIENLLNAFEYTEQTLIGVLKYAVTTVAHVNNKEFKRMIKLIVKRLENYHISQEDRNALIRHAFHVGHYIQIANFLENRWSPRPTQWRRSKRRRLE